MVEIVLCECNAVTVKANYCRACGEPLDKAKDVTISEELRQNMGSGFYRYEKIKHHVTIIPF